VATLVYEGSTRSIVRGSSGLGWLIAPQRDRWMIWLEGGAHALLSAERESSGSRIRVYLVTAGLRPFVEVSVPGTFPDFDAALLEEVVQAAVAGDLPFEPAYRSAWAIAIRTTAQELRARLG
jgi:hypothetical protein